jgi:hypothetical protein
VHSGEAEGLPAGPRLFHDADVLTGALVALVLGEEIALCRLVGGRTARDEVHVDAAVADLVEGGEHLRRIGRIRHIGAVREHDLEVVELRSDVRGGRRGVR